MKFWKRIFIYSMILFLVLFNSTGLFIIENMHKRNVDRAVKAVIDRHKGIESILYLNADSLLLSTDYMQNYDKKYEEGLNNWLYLVINGYVLNDKTEPNYIEIYDENNNKIYSNLDIIVNAPRKEINEAKVSEKSFIIRTIKDKRYVFMSSELKIKEKIIKLILVEDISYIYEERIQNYKLFILLDCFVSIILALGMFLISKRLTEPIVELSEISKEITLGNYNIRASVKSKKDEIGVLSENFNIMIESTEKNIKELENLNNAKQQFIDSLTHELKTPLTSIIGYSDLLLKGNVNDEIKFKSLSYINSEARRLEQLSLALLKLTLISKEKVSLNDISLKNCILSAAKTVSYKIESKNINLKIDVEETLIKGDLQLLTVLIINFLDNSIKASEEFSTIEVNGRYFDFNKQYILIIKDYGVGISEEDLSKIKEPFYVADKSRSRVNGGVGLGLAICDEICRVYNIKLEINSKINEGTSIILKFNEENNLL
ncbi:sensor histidine kinase [Clostridium intestinale]|uniref:histidine kinase n=1 Tax=Clostridium intestinale URNW TaxID=1294142 RepID=U2PRA0_9CLOT|nr:HAMP domain-containing sensor histidine kinase [Clostridium intestinale]ERK28960.1 putative two component regulator sensor histidine kinase transcriptional regulatory protein [Clostridium intestinale URNW]